MNALDEIRKLMREHKLLFTHNPGGGEFYRKSDDFRCQVHLQDDAADLAKLREAFTTMEG